MSTRPQLPPISNKLGDKTIIGSPANRGTPVFDSTSNSFVYEAKGEIIPVGTLLGEILQFDTVTGAWIVNGDAPADNEVLTWDTASSKWVPEASGAGEANTSSNDGAGEGLALPKVGVDLPFKSLIGGTSINLTSDADEITINAEPSTFARVVTKADQTINNSTTLVDLTEMVVALNANKTYLIEFIFWMNTSAVANMKLFRTLPAGAAAVKMTTALNGLVPVATETWSASFNMGGLGAISIVRMFIRVITAGTADDFQLQFAQNTAEVSDTKMLQGSTMIVWEELP